MNISNVCFLPNRIVRVSLTILILCICLLQSVVGQDNITKEYTLPINTSIFDTITSPSQSPAISDRDGLDVSLKGLGNGKYALEIKVVEIGAFEVVLYCEIGNDVSIHRYVIDVVSSVMSANDDFVVLNNFSNTMIIKPLSNDDFNHSNAFIKSVNLVKFGSATISNSNLLYAKNGNHNLDVIHYSISDGTGNGSEASVYIMKEDMMFSEDKYNSLKLANTTSKYLILPNSNYLLDQGALNGNLEKVNSMVYRYTPTAQFVGNEVITFKNFARKYIEFDIDVISSSADIGLIKDDVVYTAKNTEVIFNVFENDELMDLNMESYSNGLSYLGNGDFSFNPPHNYSGTRTFYYSIQGEMGMIDVIIGNFEPVKTILYEFDVEGGSELVIDYDVPISGYSFMLLKSPTYGYAYTYVEDENVLSECGDFTSKAVIQYVPVSGYTGYDEFSVEYCTEAFDCRIYKIRINIVADQNNDCAYSPESVWGGDANNDGRVSVTDVLSIGQYFGKSGTPRGSNPGWVGMESEDWNILQANGSNLKYVDANGDGVINGADLESIKQHYDNIHSFVPSEVLNIKDFPFYLVPKSSQVYKGDLLEIDIYLGYEDDPVRDIKGLAFALNIAPSFLDSASVKMEFEHNGWFAGDSPVLEFMQQPKKGNVHSAFSRVSGKTSGLGKLGTLSFIVEDEADGFAEIDAEFIMRHIFLEDIVVLDGNGNKFGVKDSAISIRLNRELEEEVKDDIETTFMIAPNPASDLVIIDGGDKLITTVNLFDLSGRKVFSNLNVNQQSLQINTSDLSSGIYLVKTNLGSKVVTSKLSIFK